MSLETTLWGTRKCEPQWNVSLETTLWGTRKCEPQCNLSLKPPCGPHENMTLSEMCVPCRWYVRHITVILVVLSRTGTHWQNNETTEPLRWHGEKLTFSIARWQLHSHVINITCARDRIPFHVITSCAYLQRLLHLCTCDDLNCFAMSSKGLRKTTWSRV